MSQVSPRWLVALGAIALLAPMSRADYYFMPVAHQPHPYAPQYGPQYAPQGYSGYPVMGHHQGYQPRYYPGYPMGPQMSTAPYGCPESGLGLPPFGPPPYGMSGHGHGNGGRGDKNANAPGIHEVPMHKYMRSPRDFFMFHENLEAERSRELRPIIVP